MNRFHFALGKWLQKEPFLTKLSNPLPDLTGKSVAIVGNARSLEQQHFGAAINRADVVIRMHAAPLPSLQSHGSKTDWLALAMPVSEALITERAPGHLLWMAKKRKRLRFRFVKHDGFYLHPVADWQNMRSRLKAPPTTGAMIIDMIARSQAARIDLYGFDFFASLSLSGRRRADQVPHDFAAEKEYVHELILQDSRITLNQ